MNVDVLVARFQQWGRWAYGTDDFRDEKLFENEHGYKRDRGDQMREWLAPEDIRQLIEMEDWTEVCHRVVRSFAMGGPLARWDEYQWVRDLDTEEQQVFALALEQFLYGDKPFLERLDCFVEEAARAYLRFRDREPAHRERYKRTTLTWPFVSYFHFMMWPDQGHVFVKPSPLQKAARLAGFDPSYSVRPNSNTYARVQEFYRALWPTVQQLGGRNWIDVQTLIHVAGEGFEMPDGGWIDQRSARAAAALSPAVSKVTALLRTKPQVVLQGAPGTGKTYTALLTAANVLGVVESDAESTRQALRRYQLARHLEDTPSLMDDPCGLADHVRATGYGLWEIVQLHPSYTYEDFVR
ncbi:MAG: hypothetical protein JXM73_20295, partial [Anaerolineae bacterium]|nr:hypothetical protein [Anaerolineae bacterium]